MGVVPLNMAIMIYDIMVPFIVVVPFSLLMSVITRLRMARLIIAVIYMLLKFVFAVIIIEIIILFMVIFIIIIKTLVIVFTRQLMINAEPYFSCVYVKISTVISSQSPNSAL